MQTPNGEYFMNDPSMLAYMQQAALLQYPSKNMFSHAAQLQQLLMAPQSLPATQQQQLRIAAAMPDFEKSMNDTIVTGSANYRASLKNSTSSISEKSQQFTRRNSPTWETLTDDERDLVQRQKRKEEAFKTALCEAHKKTGVCPYGNGCRFAHGENELRMPSQPRGKAHPKYKTQLCDKYSTFGHCPYGSRCQFIHKLKKGLPLLEYNRALAQGAISPARSDEVTNQDDSDQSIKALTHVIQRGKRSSHDLSDDGGNSCRRVLLNSEEVTKQEKVIYPPMQVINIEMATGRVSKKYRPSKIFESSQSDYETVVIDGNLFDPENSRTFSTLARAARDENSKKIGKKNVPMRKELSLISEEESMTETRHTISTKVEEPQNNENAPWYEKIFGKKMTVIREESVYEDSTLQHEMTGSREYSESETRHN
ncbi:unnamed protein product [Caenorhabditis angaria]|uniref:C3H1-type domain-containing protein n=1 Tax=Caenorhabditis angaria TaxID=860376 RepID=A0A9P1MV19_9PELO|nr:unnamed protein product [Caenorhabditis angaria]